MLDRTNCKNPVIVLKDIKCEDLEALLDYMYLGEVNVRQSDLATLIKAAECLRVKGLAVPDDEPPPRKSRASEQQIRRGDTSSSPPAKRKRRSDVDDGRDDVRPARQEPRQSSPVPSSSLRPKSPVSNSHGSSISNVNSNNKLSVSVNECSSNKNPNSQTDSNQVNDDTPNDPTTPCVKLEMLDEDDDGGGGGSGHSRFIPFVACVVSLDCFFPPYHSASFVIRTSFVIGYFVIRHSPERFPSPFFQPITSSPYC